MNIRRAQDLSNDEKQRIFSHGLHEEGIFYNRLNFFLVFESFLVAAAVSGFSDTDIPPMGIIFPLCIVGILVSVFWWFAQVNKLILLKVLEDRITASFDEFRETVFVANQIRLFRTWSANKFLAHAFPTIFVALWIYILGYSLWRHCYS